MGRSLAIDKRLSAKALGQRTTQLKELINSVFELRKQVGKASGDAKVKLQAKLDARKAQLPAGITMGNNRGALIVSVIGSDGKPLARKRKDFLDQLDRDVAAIDQDANVQLSQATTQNLAIQCAQLSALQDIETRVTEISALKSFLPDIDTLDEKGMETCEAGIEIQNISNLKSHVRNLSYSTTTGIGTSLLESLGDAVGGKTLLSKAERDAVQAESMKALLLGTVDETILVITEQGIETTPSALSVDAANLGALNLLDAYQGSLAGDVNILVLDALQELGLGVTLEGGDESGFVVRALVPEDEAVITEKLMASHLSGSLLGLLGKSAKVNAATLKGLMASIAKTLVQRSVEGFDGVDATVGKIALSARVCQDALQEADFHPGLNIQLIYNTSSNKYDLFSPYLASGEIAAALPKEKGEQFKALEAAIDQLNSEVIERSNAPDLPQFSPLLSGAKQMDAKALSASRFGVSHNAIKSESGFEIQLVSGQTLKGTETVLRQHLQAEANRLGVATTLTIPGKTPIVFIPGYTSSAGDYGVSNYSEVSRGAKLIVRHTDGHDESSSDFDSDAYYFLGESSIVDPSDLPWTAAEKCVAGFVASVAMGGAVSGFINSINPPLGIAGPTPHKPPSNNTRKK